jgi:hypothetical protein
MLAYGTLVLKCHAQVDCYSAYWDCHFSKWTWSQSFNMHISVVQHYQTEFLTSTLAVSIWDTCFEVSCPGGLLFCLLSLSLQQVNMEPIIQHAHFSCSTLPNRVPNIHSCCFHMGHLFWSVMPRWIAVLALGLRPYKVNMEPIIQHALFSYST